MLAYAKWNAYANGYDKDSKVSRLSTWEQVYKSNGKKPEALQNKPKLKEELLYIWGIFIDLRSGIEKISYSDIESYNNVTGSDLSSFEVTLILSIDRTYNSNG